MKQEDPAIQTINPSTLCIFHSVCVYVCELVCMAFFLPIWKRHSHSFCINSEADNILYVVYEKKKKKDKCRYIILEAHRFTF